MPYLDFPVHFTRSSQGALEARVIGAPAGEAAERFAVDRSTMERWRSWGRAPDADRRAGFRHVQLGTGPSEADAESLGTELFTRLFTGRIRHLWDESRGMAGPREEGGLRLRLHFDLSSEDGRELAGCPWELLYRPETRSFLALDRRTPLARFYDVPRAPDPPEMPFPLRVGLVSANPDGMVPLDLERERRRIEEVLTPCRGIECRSFEGTARGLRAAVVEGACHVLHFMGHADVASPSGRGFLAAERRDGSLHPLEAPELADLLRGPALQLVVLNACRTGDVVTPGEATLYRRLVPSLTLAGVRAVIAMSSAIRDRSAIAFSEGLYPALAGGDPVDVALTEARLAIRGEVRDREGWVLPALFLRGHHAELFRPEPDGERPSGQARRLFERGRAALAEGDFRRARTAFAEAMGDHAGYGRAEAEYCFATLAERGASRLTRRQAEALNRKLERLSRSSTPDVRSLALLLLGVLRCEFFEVRRVKASGMASEELYQLVRSQPTGEGDAERLAALNPSTTARLRLGLPRRGPGPGPSD